MLNDVLLIPRYQVTAEIFRLYLKVTLGTFSTIHNVPQFSTLISLNMYLPDEIFQKHSSRGPVKCRCFRNFVKFTYKQPWCSLPLVNFTCRIPLDYFFWFLIMHFIIDIPMGKYLVQAKNKNTKLQSSDYVPMSFLLTQNKYMLNWCLSSDKVGDGKPIQKFGCVNIFLECINL